MASRLAALLPRLIALTVMWLLATSTFTFAAGNRATPPSQPAPAAAAQAKTLTVPDVRGKAYVFAKGILQDAGFSWRVDGTIEGYSANTVALQNPAPGMRVVDNGAPLVLLRLDRNKSYGERGLPENSSPFASTRVVLLSVWRKEQKMPLPDRARRLDARMAAVSKPTKRLVNFWLYQHSWIVAGARFGWHDGADALRILIATDEKLQARFGFGGRSARVARHALVEVENQLP
jgi:PASTA domain